LSRGLDSSEGKWFTVLQGRGATAAAINADGRIAVSGCSDGSVWAWDVDAQRRLCALAGPSKVHAVALSADGSLALAACDDGGVRAWDLRGERCLHVLEGHTGSVRSVALSADGLTGCSGGSDRTVHVWDLASGQCLHVLGGHERDVEFVGMSADAGRVVSAMRTDWVHRGSILRVWDVATASCERAIALPDASSLAISADGCVAVTGADWDARYSPWTPGRVSVWELATGRRVHQRDTIGEIVAGAADASRAVSVCMPDGKFLLHEWHPDETMTLYAHEITAGVSAEVNLHADIESVVISADGRVVVLVFNSPRDWPAAKCFTGAVAMWRLARSTESNL